MSIQILAFSMAFARIIRVPGDPAVKGGCMAHPSPVDTEASVRAALPRSGHFAAIKAPLCPHPFSSPIRHANNTRAAIPGSKRRSHWHCAAISSRNVHPPLASSAGRRPAHLWTDHRHVRQACLALHLVIQGWCLTQLGMPREFQHGSWRGRHFSAEAGRALVERQDVAGREGLACLYTSARLPTVGIK